MNTLISYTEIFQKHCSRENIWRGNLRKGNHNLEQFPWISHRRKVQVFPPELKLTPKMGNPWNIWLWPIRNALVAMDMCIQVSLFWRGHLGILFVLYFYKFIKHEHEYIHVCKCSVNCCCSRKALLRDLLSVETIWVDNFKVGYHLTTSFQLCHVTQTQESANCTTI